MNDLVIILYLFVLGSVLLITDILKSINIFLGTMIFWYTVIFAIIIGYYLYKSMNRK